MTPDYSLCTQVVTLYRLEAFLDGDMDEMIDGLILAERTAQLSGEAE